jgi:hypothetical protein
MSAPDGSPASEADEPSVEWSARFRQYLEHSADRLNRTAELNKELTKRIACGDVAPVIVESQLAAFLATNAESFANEMADLTLRFLSSLVGVNSWYARALVQHVSPGTPSLTEPDQPRFEPISVDWFDRLNDYAAAETATVYTLLRAALEAAGADGDEREVAEEVGQRHFPTTVAKTADLFLDLLTRLEDINSTHVHRYLEAVLGRARDADKSPTTLLAVAPLGETATVRFAVSNNTQAPASIRCVMTDLRRCDGVGPAFEPVAAIMPDRFDLPAGKEEVLTLSIRLAESDFTAGPAYTGGVRVFGVGDTVVEIPVDLRASMSADPGESLSAAEPL